MIAVWGWAWLAASWALFYVARGVIRANPLHPHPRHPPTEPSLTDPLAGEDLWCTNCDIPLHEGEVLAHARVRHPRLRIVHCHPCEDREVPVAYWDVHYRLYHLTRPTAPEDSRRWAAQ